MEDGFVTGLGAALYLESYLQLEEISPKKADEHPTSGFVILKMSLLSFVKSA